MPNLRYRTLAERKTNSARGGLKLWHEYNIIFDGIVSVWYMSWPLLEHAPSIRRFDTIYLSQYSRTRRIHESQCSYQLTSKRTWDRVRGSFSMYTFAISVCCSRHRFGIWTALHVYTMVFCRRSASVFTSRRIRFLIIYICSLERMLWIRKYQINGKLELATDPLQCHTTHRSSHTTLND